MFSKISWILTSKKSCLAAEVVEILINNGADIEAVDEVNNVHKLIVANITNI